MNNHLIDVGEAKKRIEEQAFCLSSVKLSLPDAAGKITAKNIFSQADFPSFPQSGMDGYAFAYESLGKPILVVGEQQAGSVSLDSILSGTAIRIFTGAAVPNGADTVVIQERCKIEDGFLIIEDEKLVKGSNVRPAGSEIKENTLAIAAGSKLSPASIGFLASMGWSEIEVIPSPRISIIITGNELLPITAPSEYGKVYESNAHSLLALFKQLNIDGVKVYHAKDEVEMITDQLQQALNASDLVLMTGGVSVGDYDFTVKVSEICGIEKVFHKIRQKPGKPLFFGKKDKVLFFGLPGNPASVLTCFYEYVLPALEKLTARQLSLQKVQAIFDDSYQKPAGITHFLKGMFEGEKVKLLPAQESYKLNSFAFSNCLIMVPEAVTQIAVGEKVEIHLLPQ